MAATTTPLVWDFYRAVPDAEGLGSVVEYYDEWSQSLYLASGLKTQTAIAEDGHWSESDPGPEQTISSADYTASAWDHPLTGQLYGAAIIGGELFFLRYLYAKELSQILKSGTWKARNDSQITQMSLRLENAGQDYFLGPASLFAPGARITAAVSMGGGVPYKIGEVYLDEFDFAAHAADVALKKPGARDRDDAISDAREAFDWERQFSCAIDPDRARELRQEAIKESDPSTHHDGKFCTMCGPDFCSVRLSAKLKKLLK